MITILYEIVNEILNLYKWAVILAAVFSMLVAFGVLDTRNRMVWTIGDFLYRITEPALRPIRNMLPNFGGIDISPIILIFAIYVVQMLLGRVYGAIVYGNIQGLFLWAAVTARIIDGKAVAAALRAALQARVAALPYRPGLAVVLVGDDAASAIYVRSKDRAAQAAGIAARSIRLPAATAQAELLGVVARLNADPAVDGILVQLPLPPHLSAATVIEAIDPAKDVDGLHPINAGRLMAGVPGLVACTPLGVMKLLEASGVPLAGARALVLGRSVLVGKPVAALLAAANATVTLAHSHTRDLPGECRRAEVLVAAAGRPELVRGDWIAPGAVVIDVGINRLADGSLVGDVAFAEAAGVAGAITPVPGGVGPMTIACLLENTVTAALRRRQG